MAHPWREAVEKYLGRSVPMGENGVTAAIGKMYETLRNAHSGTPNLPRITDSKDGGYFYSGIEDDVGLTEVLERLKASAEAYNTPPDEPPSTDGEEEEGVSKALLIGGAAAAGGVLLLLLR